MNELMSILTVIGMITLGAIVCAVCGVIISMWSH
jgi:hypothetical protein